MRLLIVDDSENERMILKEMLQSEGHAVEEAENGQQALEMALLSPPDMIISDILMPVMDGFQLCRKIRSDKKTSGIPFVFYTGTYTKAEDEDFAFKMGADRFLVKRMGWPDFFRELQDVIRKKEVGGNVLPELSLKDEKEIYKLYNERLIKKLEDKVSGLENEVGWRKKLEKQLHDSNESLQLALNGADLGMWDWNVQTGEVKFNQQLVKNFGYEAHELVPHVDTWEKMIHPDDRQKTMDALKPNLNGATNFYENEHRIRTKDGQWRWFLARGKVVGRDDAGNALRHMGTFLDIHDHKASLKEFEKEKERYRLIFNTAPIGILHYDTAGEVTECNSKSIDMIASTREKFIGFNIFKGVKNKYLINAVKDSLAGKLSHAEGAYTSVAGGRKFYAKADFAPVVTSSGKVAGGICVVEDITKKIVSEKVLKKSEEKYRTILESIEDGYFEVDLFGNLIFFNTALCDILGYPKSELKGKNYRSYMDAENAAKTFQTFNQVYETGDSLKGFEWKIIRKDGTGGYLDTSVSLINDARGNSAGFRGVTRDVSERRLMEKFLAESEERFRLIFEFAPVGIYHYNKQGVVQACNKACFDISGSSFEKFVGFNLLKGVTNRRVLDAIKSSLAGSPKHYEGKYISVTGGRTRYINADFIPFFSESKTVAGGMCVCEDITERKKAEAELRLSRRQLSALSKHLQQSREQERSGIAREIHDDLGQILTAIKMDAVWLQGKIPEDQPVLYKKAEDTISLVDAAIQSVKRISSDLRPGLLDDLGLAAAIEWQAGEYQKRSGIHINVSTDPENIILGDDLSIAVFRICQETMTNIVRHSKSTDAWLDLIVDSEVLTLVVFDNGIGITDKELGKNKSFGLIGMRERVQSFGGQIKIFKIKDGGTKVDVRIPITAEDN